ncbi:MAG TPA: ABC transporter permease [Blastocatellia bacterium]|nr:ABC transporter permease [Blastocatellia bacterium]
MNETWRDLRYGLRTLIKSPGFTAIAVLVLAAGIGANTAIFSVVNGVLLRPLPFKDPDKLVMIRDLQPPLDETPMDYDEFRDWRQQGQLFEEVSGFFNASYTLTGSGEPEELKCVRASANLFPMLGVAPALGRAFLPDEELATSEPVAMISSGLWQRIFAGRSDCIGETLKLSDRVYTVVGVLPSTFRGALPGNLQAVGAPDVWIPLRLRAPPSGLHFLTVLARLQPGLDIRNAGPEIEAASARIQQERSTNHTVKLVKPRDYITGAARPALLILLGAVCFVLLIACANVASLLMARTAGRRKEIAIRLALGASRWRLVRQMLTESLLLGSLGSLAGLLIASWGVDLLVFTGRTIIPRVDEIKIDASVLAFTLGISLLSGVLFGLAPALQCIRADLQATLKEGARGAITFERHRLRSLLVIAEVGLSLVLLVGAGLLIRSFERVVAQDKGFDPSRLLTADLSLSQSKYEKIEQQSLFIQQTLERVRAIPGVEASGAISNIPLGGGGTNGDIGIEGKTFPPDSAAVAEKRIASAGYFETARIRLIAGRYFTERDVPGTPQVAIINEALARTFFPGEDPIGKRIDFRWDTTGLQEIVGVVADVKHYALDTPVLPEVYVPFAQRPSRGTTIVIRSRIDPASLVGVVRQQIFELDKGQAVSNVRTMEQIVSESVASRRLSMSLLAGFAVVALLLASMGLYGTLSYSVAQRTQEIGIRSAMGAQPGDIFKLVVGHGMKLTLAGIGFGLVGSLALTKLLATFLFGVSASDPVTYAGVAVLLLGITLLACYVPARRASKVDPIVALRYE